MLIINNKNIDVLERYVNFDLFEGTIDGKKRKCNVLYITCVTNDFRLSIETMYDINWIKELKINDKKDISKYIMGLPYEDDKGWMYLESECNCTLNRINNNTYEIELNGTFEECSEKFNIKYKDTFEINNI